MRHSLPYVMVLILIILASCVTKKKVTYLQELEGSTDSLYVPVIPEDYKVMINDNLYIRVITPDPRWSDMFNSVPINSATMGGEAAIDLISYEVHPNGTIDIPFVGEVEVLGKTVPEVKDIVDEALTDFITDADITVKLVNNYISILGEVNRPGLYPIYKQQMNLFQALSMAGDLDDFSDRCRVQIIRQTENGSVIKEFNLTDRSILDSDFYYVLPNDVIYAMPMKGKFFQMNAFPYGVIISTLTFFVLMLNVIQD